MTNRFLAAVTGIMLALSASASRAAMVEAIVDTNSDDAVDSVTFPTLTGDSDAGVVASYGGFTQINLTTISRTLDPTARVVVALDIDALQGDVPCPTAAASCSDTTLSSSPALATINFEGCSSFGDGGGCSDEQASANIKFAPAAAPEPSTWATMVVGLTGSVLWGADR